MEQNISRTVVVLFEDSETQNVAVKFCDQLVERFWKQCAFELKWVAFACLSEPAEAERAARLASAAGVLVFAGRAQSPLPRDVAAWIETWIHQRADREGLLIGLHHPAEHHSGSLREVHLRNIAHRLGMDYLEELPHQIIRNVPDSLDSISQRAAQVTSVLDNILRKHPRSTETLP